MSGAAATSEGEKLFMAKFNLSRSDASSGEDPTAGSSTALGPAAVPEAPAPAESMSRAAPAAAGAGPRFTYQSLSIVTNNFEKRRLFVSLSRSAGVGDACCGEKARARRGGRRRSSGAIYDRSNAYRCGVLLSQVQHVNIVPLLGSSKDGTAPCLVYALMEGGSLQDRLAYRGSGAWCR